MTESKYTVGQAYRTRGGWKAKIVFAKETGCFVCVHFVVKGTHFEQVMWHYEKGSAQSGEKAFDLVEPWRDPINNVREVWIEFVRDGKPGEHDAFGLDWLLCSKHKIIPRDKTYEVKKFRITTQEISEDE